MAVTQQFNTTTSMGRLTLNVLLSFAQFEREVTTAASTSRARGHKEWFWPHPNFCGVQPSPES